MKTEDSGLEAPAEAAHAETLREQLHKCIDIDCIGYGNPFPAIGNNVACLHCKGATMRLG